MWNMKFYYLLLICIIIVSIFGQENKEEKNGETATEGQEEDTTHGTGNLSPLDVLAIILKNRPEEILKLEPEQVLNWVEYLADSNITTATKNALWNTAVRKKQPNTLTVDDFKPFRKMLLAITENDLYKINYNDKKIVEFFSVAKGLTRRMTGIIGAALKKIMTDNLLQRVEVINTIKGLICAYPSQELATIEGRDFIRIADDVFDYIYTCEESQIKVLLNMALEPTAYGEPFLWNATVVRRLGLLITSMGDETFSQIRPPAIKGLRPETLERMKSCIHWLTDEQLSNLSQNSTVIYRLYRIDKVSHFSCSIHCYSEHTFYIIFGSLILKLAYCPFYLFVSTYVSRFGYFPGSLWDVAHCAIIPKKLAKTLKSKLSNA